MEIVKLTAADCGDCLDFINMVFSMAYGRLNFEDIQYRLYREEESLMNCHYAVKENGRIRAVVGLFPSLVRVGSAELKLGGIGSVSVHPADRGKGYMKLLMNCCIDEMKRDFYDLSYLNGLRQRYAYFGYERTGSMLEYTLTSTNMRHYKADADSPLLNFVPVGKDSLELLRKMKALHDSEPVYCERSEADFYYYLLAEYAKPWAALYPDGSFAGYVAANPDNTLISEIFAKDKAAFAALIRSWFIVKKPPRVKVSLPVWSLDSARYLSGIAEHFSLSCNDNWRFYNWPKVISAFMTLKNELSGLLDGNLCINITDYGTICINVTEGVVSCKFTTSAPDLSLDSFSAARLIFGNVPAVYNAEIPLKLRSLINSWFPLPLSWIPQNHV